MLIKMKAVPKGLHFFLSEYVFTLAIAVLLLIFSQNLYPGGRQDNSLQHIRLATTSSTENSGLLTELLPPFQEKYGIQVDVIAVGTGKAITLGENGDVDLILVHARSKEDLFVEEGYGINRRDVMHNDFVILGPVDDPAGIKGMTNAPEALKRIAYTKSDFLSRGDDSGTHSREKALWIISGITPSGIWYKETGQAMGTVLTMADEIQGYTISDRGTYLALKDKLDLQVLVEKDDDLYNPYGVIAVNPERHNHVNYAGAMDFISFLTSVKGQAIIGRYRKNGELLFYPDALTSREL